MRKQKIFGIIALVALAILFSVRLTYAKGGENDYLYQYPDYSDQSYSGQNYQDNDYPALPVDNWLGSDNDNSNSSEPSDYVTFDLPDNNIAANIPFDGNFPDNDLSGTNITYFDNMPQTPELNTPAVPIPIEFEPIGKPIQYPIEAAAPPEKVESVVTGRSNEIKPQWVSEETGIREEKVSKGVGVNENIPDLRFDDGRSVRDELFSGGLAGVVDVSIPDTHLIVESIEMPSQVPVTQANSDWDKHAIDVGGIANKATIAIGHRERASGPNKENIIRGIKGIRDSYSENSPAPSIPTYSSYVDVWEGDGEGEIKYNPKVDMRATVSTDRGNSTQNLNAQQE